MGFEISVESEHKGQSESVAEAQQLKDILIGIDDDGVFSAASISHQNTNITLT